MPSPQEIRDANLAYLNEHGFQPATWMPLPNEVGTPAEDGFPGGILRPAEEIAIRLMCHCAVFAWGSAPPEFEEPIAAFISDNDLRSHLLGQETVIIGLSKTDATAQFAEMVGWRLENMWSLAWLLGLAEEPSAVIGQLPPEVSGPLMGLFLPDFTATVETLTSGDLQPVEEVIRAEDLFYLAHNAVRSGQLGELGLIPDGFDPIGSGGAIHERRHSLTWALAPGTRWHETDLST